jgi:sigma-54 dependent transcriptional regulator, acetoin dehydrogenase operon transcriptional activator AcoR
VVSATHHSLDELVESGRFREDLYYRLNGARFALPPLRERTDLDWLIQKLLADAPGGAVALSPAARERLHRHRWPGNLRELCNVLRYARAVCSDGHIEVDDLPENVSASVSVSMSEAAAPALQGASVAHEEFDPHLLSPEGMLLMQYLRAASWNLSAVARQIGVSRMTLYRRMARYGIRSPNQRDAGAH